MKIKVLGIQSGTVEVGMTDWEYVEKQVSFMEKAVIKEKPYLVMFPEMMTGRYFGCVLQKKWFDNAEDFFTGPTTTLMLKKSKELNIHIVYSLFEKAEENGKKVYYNTLGLISPIRGIIGRYRKIHIPGGDLRYNNVYEKYYFKSGDSMPVFELDNGVKIAMMLCYDRSFPEQWRTYFLKRAQIICVATCTMGLRADMFVTELQTRGLESHSFVIALNRCGKEQVEGEDSPRQHFGKSLIVNPLGNIIASLGDEEWAYITSELDMDEITYARGRLNWERDRHPELYGMVSDTNSTIDHWIFEKGF